MIINNIIWKTLKINCKFDFILCLYKKKIKKVITIIIVIIIIITYVIYVYAYC